MRNRYTVPSVCRQCEVSFFARPDQRGGYCGRPCAQQAVRDAGAASSDTKTCTQCGEIKSSSAIDFPRDRKGRGGLSARCKACAYAYHARWHRENTAYVAQKRSGWYHANRTRVIASEAHRSRAWILANQEKYRLCRRGNDAIYKAIKRGVLIRPTTCESCGIFGKIEAAHSDYSRPIDVRWLCRSCHVRWDHAEPKLR
jgi:transcription elongation factor Elf1